MRQLSRHTNLYKAVYEPLVISLFTLSTMSHQTYYPAFFYDSFLNIPCNGDGAPYYGNVTIPADLLDLPDLTYSPPKLQHFPTGRDFVHTLGGCQTLASISSPHLFSGSRAV